MTKIIKYIILILTSLMLMHYPGEYPGIKIASENIIDTITSVSDDANSVLPDQIQDIKPPVPAPPADVTENLQLLGNPFTKDTYARNIWDMQVYNGSIYLGHGNSSNFGPSANAGPVDIIKYSSGSGEFTKEYTVNEEQIDIFRIINGNLFIPGHDPREPWDLGNYYTLSGSTWTKVRTVPLAIHIYDMAGYNGKLYVAAGTNGFSEVASSSDNGKTWDKVQADTRFVSRGYRAYSMFEYKDKLYAASAFVNNDKATLNNLLCIDKSKTTVVKVKGTKMFPGTGSEHIVIKLTRPSVYKDKLLYIGGEEINDHQNRPLALYLSEEVGVAEKVDFNETNVVPYDILVRNTAVYVLTNLNITDNEFKVAVYKSSDLESWNELFYFSSDAFARSFEEIDGDFYIGLGCDTKYMPESTGKIIKVSKTDYMAK